MVDELITAFTLLFEGMGELYLFQEKR